jgi:adenylosuccinate lyase
MLIALSPLDGRYEETVKVLRPFFSEEALIKARVEVEIAWFIALGSEKRIRELRVSGAQAKKLRAIVEKFSTRDAEAVKTIEKKTKHDVKAVEYFLKEKIKRISGLKKSTEFVHFALTSEDVNNLAYGILIHRALAEVIRPTLKNTLADLSRLSAKWKKIPMLSLTHGQPATPTTVGREFAVFAERLERQLSQLKSLKMQGKFGGAVGNYSAHKAAYPGFAWESYGAKFVRSLGLSPITSATQINPHDDIAELSHVISRINTILLDLSRDMWFYISRGVFTQRVVAGEVGSSTMPHKVNPIDFENAEGNLGLSTALFTHFAEKLPVSRMQRDLSDSTVLRSIGTAFGYHTLAVASLSKGLSKIELDRTVTKAELDAHPELRAEGIQTVLRKFGVQGAYELLKKLTRGEKVTHRKIDSFVDELPLPKGERDRLKVRKN